MFFAGKTAPVRDDYRPEIHDSDGLYMLTGGDFSFVSEKSN
jgi:periplasmic glucans biosynthesis protein